MSWADAVALVLDLSGKPAILPTNESGKQSFAGTSGPENCTILVFFGNRSFSGWAGDAPLP